MLKPSPMYRSIAMINDCTEYLNTQFSLTISIDYPVFLTSINLEIKSTFKGIYEKMLFSGLSLMRFFDTVEEFRKSEIYC